MDAAADDRKARLTKVRDREVAREKARAREAEDRELEWGELEDRLEQTHGRSGKDFAILRTVDGLVAVKRGSEAAHWTSFRSKLEAATSESPIHHADITNFVTPLVIHPTREKFEELIDRIPGVGTACANALTRLYQGEEVARSPK